MKPLLKFLTNIGMIFLIILSSESCKKIDDTYKEFIDSGETVYVGKADSVLVRSGRDRVELSWLYSDPKISSYKVYWDNKKDSLIGDIQNTGEGGWVSLLIEDLSEGIHFFEIYLFDKQGNSSVQVETIGSSYGNQFQSSLLPQTYKNVYWEDDGMIVEWNATSGEDIVLIGKEASFLNSLTDIEVKEFLPATEVDAIPISFKSGEGILNYRTAFLPDSNALDTFYAEPITVVLDYEVEIDKSNWKILKLDNDVYDAKQATRYPEMIFDGSIGVAFIVAEVPDMYPHSISIDLGEKVLLKHIRKNDYWTDARLQGYLFERGSPRIYEVWGSNDPTMDGDWSKWTLLGSFESVKPSGGAWNDDLTSEDIEAGKEGELFPFGNVTESYRYVRFKTIETWRPTEKSPWIAELTFYGVPQE